MDWLLDNIDRPYPFDGPMAVDRSLESCLVDAVITHRGLLPADALAVVLKSLNLTTEVVVIGLSDGSTLFTGSSPTTAIVGDFKIYQWSGTDTVVKFVIYTPNYAALSWPIVPTTATFDPSVVPLYQEPVTSVTVGLDTISLGDLVFQEGYNCSLPIDSVDTSYGVPQPLVTVDFIPGEGLGRYDACGDVPLYVTSINGQGPDDLGDFWLTGDPCILALPDVVANAVELHTACVPCCECDDYTATYTAIRVMLQESQVSVVSVLGNVRAAFSSLIAGYGIEQTNREKVHFKVRLYPKLNWMVGVQVQVANMTRDTVPAGTEIGLWFTFDDDETCAFTPDTNQWQTIADRVYKEDPVKEAANKFVIDTPEDIKPGSWATYIGMIYIQPNPREDGSNITLDGYYGSFVAPEYEDDDTDVYHGDVNLDEA